MEIVTNHQPRELVSWSELPEKFQEEFDYVDPYDRDASPRFFKYRNWWYDVDEFMRAPDGFVGWDGYQSDTFFSGILIRYANEFEDVIVGRYWG